MIVIVDFGMGNTGSVLNIIKKVGGSAIVSSNMADIQNATKLIFPGVGSFDTGMRNLKKLGLIEVLSDAVLNKKKMILGICLGLQLFSKTSEEGELAGLGWINAKTVKFQGITLPVPHMGWNHVSRKKAHFILDGLDNASRFYFVHSYHLITDNSDIVVGTSYYAYDFTSIVAQGNILGVQFHPEKSHKYGYQLIRNFINA